MTSVILQIQILNLKKNLKLISYESGQIECKIAQVHLDKLLEILKARLLPSLPKSSKTFLRTTDADYRIEQMADSQGGVGSFVYFGILGRLQNCIKKSLHEGGIIEVQIHANAMPVSKSGTDNFWVLAGKVHYDPDVYKPF